MAPFVLGSQPRGRDRLSPSIGCLRAKEAPAVTVARVRVQVWEKASHGLPGRETGQRCPGTATSFVMASTTSRSSRWPHFAREPEARCEWHQRERCTYSGGNRDPLAEHRDDSSQRASAILHVVRPPLSRERLAERNNADDREAIAVARSLSPGQRLAQALDLSDTARSLARSVGARWIEQPPDDLAEKARRTPTLVAG